MYDWNKFCRLCLTEEGVEIDLFDESAENCKVPLYEKVVRCVPVQIEMGDCLPTLVCKGCADLIDKIWNLKAVSEHVDLSLRKLLIDRKAKFNWEDQVKSIAKETLSLAAKERQCKKKRKLAEPQPSPLKTEIESEFCNEAFQNSVLNHQPDFNDDWTEPRLSPESPESPQSAMSGNEDECSLPKTKRKRQNYACEFCGRKFSRSNHLAQHELTHRAEKPFLCSECGKTFSYKASLVGHIKQMHTGDVNYTCDLCGKGYFKKTELTRHRASHSNETPHKCPQCGMGFKIPKTLKRHIRNVHTAQRSHICHTCGKSFIQLQTLKVHMVIHSGVKPHTCSYCGKGFTQSAPLKTHMRIHTGEKPFTCHVCQDAFSTRSALTSHAFKHKNVLPYPCTRCDRSFRIRKDLICHEQGHDDVEARLRQFPEIKQEGSDSMEDSMPNQEELSQESEVINHFEDAISDDGGLYDTFQDTILSENQPASPSNSMGCHNNSILEQFSPTMSVSSQLHESYPTHDVDVHQAGSQRQPVILMRSFSNCCN